MSATTDRLAKQAVQVNHDLREMGVIAKDVARESLGQIRQNAADRYGQGRDTVRDTLSTVEQYVRDRPVQSLLIASGVGLLLGRFWMRR